MQQSGAARRGAQPLALAAAAMVLVPYATLTLPFRTALLAQAGALLALLAALGIWAGLARHPRPAWRSRPRWWRWGVALWAGATLLGTLVGLARGNPSSALAGQVLSLAFLPVGALVARPGEGERAGLLTGLVGGTVAASLFHLGHWLVTGAAAGSRYRFFLANDVSVAGIVLAALLLASSALAGGDPRRRLALVACLVLGLFVVGSGVRGLWLVAPAAWLVYRLLSAEPWRLGRSTWVVGAATTLLALAGLATTLHLGRSFPNRLPSEHPGIPLLGGLTSLEPLGHQPHSPVAIEWRGGEKPQVVMEAAGPFEPGTWRLSATLVGGDRGQATVALSFSSDGGEVVGSVGLKARPQSEWTTHQALAPLDRPAAWATLEIASQPEASGTWRLSTVRLERIGPSHLAPWLGQTAYSLTRLRRTWQAVRGDPAAFQEDPSLGMRLLESRTLWRTFRDGALSQQLFGRGLGALFALPADEASRLGVSAAPRNYVHNFYLFLLVKLGLLGAVAILTALVLLAGGLTRATLASPQGPDRRFLAAAAAALVGYAVLSVSSPELVNFRVTPLLGLLLGVVGAAQAGPGPGADNPASASSSR
ncbi:MAG TPA: hypothetical protein VF017_12165 [Thermoanaerobaculia bacterium]|nr:hypothetical protein [Thermoanaerobaculia bacterium]